MYQRESDEDNPQTVSPVHGDVPRNAAVHGLKYALIPCWLSAINPSNRGRPSNAEHYLSKGVRALEHAAVHKSHAVDATITRHASKLAVIR